MPDPLGGLGRAEEEEQTEGEAKNEGRKGEERREECGSNKGGGKEAQAFSILKS